MYIIVSFQDPHSVQYQQFLAKKSTSATKRSADADESRSSKKQLTIDEHINQNQTIKKVYTVGVRTGCSVDVSSR